MMTSLPALPGACADGRPLDATITLRATEWMVALMGPGVTEAQQLACRHWRAEHPDHERAWRQLESFTGRLAALPGAAASAALAASGQRRPRAGRRQALAVLGTGMAAAGAWHLLSGHLPREADVLRAAVGQRQRLALPDGSTLEMNSGTEVAVRFTAAERRLVLLSGEIAVATAPDPMRQNDSAERGGRPFRVQTTHGLLRALGTEFTVRQHSEGTLVSVQQGAVEIRAGDPQHIGIDGVIDNSLDVPLPAGMVRVLSAGQRASFTRTSVQAPQLADPADTAWTRGMLVAFDMRLDTFLAELSRHRPGHLHCADDVAALRISGVYPLDETDRILDALPGLLPVQVWRLTRYLAGVRARHA